MSRGTANCFFDLTVTRTRCSLTGRGITSSSALCHVNVRHLGVTSVSGTSLLALGLSLMGTHGALRGGTDTLGHTVFSLTSFLGVSGGAMVRLRLPTHPQRVAVSMSSTLTSMHDGGPRLLKLGRGVLRTREGISQAGGRSHFGTDIGTDVNFGRTSSGFKSICRGPVRRSLISIDLSVPLIS